MFLFKPLCSMSEALQSRLWLELFVHSAGAAEALNSHAACTARLEASRCACYFRLYSTA